MIPKAYLDAKRRGASQRTLMKLVEDMCLQALQEHATYQGKPVPMEVELAFVTMTYELYEYKFQSMAQKP